MQYYRHTEQIPNYPNGLFSIHLRLHIVYKIVQVFIGISEG